VKQGNQQQDYATYQADIAAADAQQQKELGVVQADRTRTAAKYVKGTARAGYGASGVDVNSGSSADVQQHITSASEQDAWQQILTGNRAYNSGMNSAAAMRVAGANAAQAGYAGAAKSLMGGVANDVLQGWKTRIKPQQAPAPVESRSASSAMTISDASGID
jgi:hypothetical protein